MTVMYHIHLWKPKCLVKWQVYNLFSTSMLSSHSRLHPNPITSDSDEHLTIPCSCQIPYQTLSQTLSQLQGLDSRLIPCHPFPFSNPITPDSRLWTPWESPWHITYLLSPSSPHSQYDTSSLTIFLTTI